MFSVSPLESGRQLVSISHPEVTDPDSLYINSDSNQIPPKKTLHISEQQTPDSAHWIRSQCVGQIPETPGLRHLPILQGKILCVLSGAFPKQGVYYIQGCPICMKYGNAIMLQSWVLGEAEY